MKPGALALISLIFAASLASCGNVTAVGQDGGTTGGAGKPATGSAGTTGAAGTGAAGTGMGSGSAGPGAAGTGAAGTGMGTGAAGTGTSTGMGTGAAGTGAAGTGTAGTGMSTGAAGTGAAGTGAAGTGAAGAGNRPCIDKLCQGACTGDSCGGTWTCDPMVACIEIAAQYCGCDGKTFTASGCSPRAFAHRGACEAGVSCDPTAILCKRLAPTCPAGQVPSVEGTCYGPCVKVEQCNCTGPAACPQPNQYTCHMNTKRCGPYVN